jgi:ATP-dependent Clp protease ATP-binding subunit ClpC
MDIAAQLLPSIERNEIHLILEATAEEVARADRTHGAFVRALRAQVVAPLAPVQAQLALSSAAKRVAKQRRVSIEDSALPVAVDMVERFGEAGGIPGAAVELLRAATRGAPRAKASIVNAESVVQAFLARTGYPRQLVDARLRLAPDDVLAALQSRVVGQTTAVRLLRDLVVTLKTGLTDPSRPLGASLLLGPTGVGKTESALSLAAYLFSDDRRLVRFDMAEYAAPGSGYRLLAGGAARGSRTVRVREQPFGVVLLDEIEKADPGVHDLLLQLLGEGRLTDAEGHTVSFRNTVVLMTSNLGADTAGSSLGFASAGFNLDRHYLSAATQFFRPELLNRLDHVVAYHPLAPAEVRLIASRAVTVALRREGLVRRGVEVLFDEALVDHLAAVGFDARYGARPLKRAIEKHLVTPLAALLSANSDTLPRQVRVSIGDNGEVQLG